MKKRILSVLLSLFIICGVVLADYERVQAVDLPTAFWGTMEASRAWFTAMQAGGALDRGVSFEQFKRSSGEDWKNLERLTMEAFKLWIAAKISPEIANKFPSFTPSEVAEEAIREAVIIANNFKNNAIEVSGTTKPGISVKDFGYWQEFCKEFSSIAKNGLGSGSIGPDTVITVPINNPYNLKFSSQALNNIGANTFVYNDKYFITKGKYNGNDYEITDVPTDRVRIPYVNVVGTLDSSNVYCYLYLLDIYRLTGEIITVSTRAQNSYNMTSFSYIADLIHGNTSFPTMFGGTGNQISDWRNDYMNTMSVSTGGQAALDWQYQIQDALDDSTAGAAIKDGNTKQSSKQAVREGSVPIKRSSLKEEERNGEKVVTGVVGWDIPGTREIEGSIADPRTEGKVIEDMGIIDVPAEEVENPDIPGEIVVPGEAEVIIPAEDDPIPIPIEDIFKIQYGPFYPTSMSITEFFPFCIPFDIAYCVNKFRVGEGEAPVLQIPIVYPRALQGVLGQSYDVTIDFNDYIALRNIIRYFILILFIVGLMTLTRNIIRG